MRRAALACALSLIAANARAYRPFLTEDADVAAYHRPELELSIDHWSWRDDSQTRQYLATVNYGLLRRLEISLELPSIEHRPASGPTAFGPGDVTLATKFQLLPETERRPAFLMRNSVKTQSGDSDRGLGTGTTDVAAIMAASKHVGSLRLHAQLGVIRVGGPTPPRRHLYQYGVAADLALSESARLAAECFGSRHPDDVAPDPVSGGLGIIVPLKDGLAFDAIVRRGLSRSAAPWQGTVGLSFAF